MTYQEMQERLTKVETLIKAVQQPRYQNTVQNVQETLSKLSTIKENLENKMKILVFDTAYRFSYIKKNKIENIIKVKSINKFFTMPFISNM